jgi:hypothetical protein
MPVTAPSPISPRREKRAKEEVFWRCGPVPAPLRALVWKTPNLFRERLPQLPPV